MPATAASQQAPTVDQPEHPLHALTTYELAYYRRRLENAIAYLGKQEPAPAIRTDMQAALARPGSPIGVPIQARMTAIDTELAGRAAARRTGSPGSRPARSANDGTSQSLPALWHRE